MPRPEDSLWAVPVAQVASRAGRSKLIDQDFPAPSGIGDDVIGVREDAPVHVSGSFDSIIDGLVLTARVSAPVHAECTRCLTPITRDWTVNVTAFFPYSDDPHGRDDAKGEVDIVAGEEEAADIYPLLDGDSFADLEALLRDTLVEALPLQPLCREDCKGLCPQCGVDLNEQPDHHHEVTDDRFAVLAGLKARLESEQTGR